MSTQPENPPSSFPSSFPSRYRSGAPEGSVFPVPPPLPRLNEDPERLISLLWQIESEDVAGLDTRGLRENFSIYQALIDHACARQAEVEALLAHRRRHERSGSVY